MRLGDVLAATLDFRGRTPKKLGMHWGGGDIPALSALNVRPGEIDLSRTRHYGSNALYERWMTQGDAQKGDVVVTTEAPLGNVAQVPGEGRYILSQRVILLKPNREVLDADFLARYMRSPGFQEMLRANATGTTARGIRQARLLELPLVLPPLNEQRRIVAKIEASFARSRRAKKALDRIPPLLDRLRQSILAAAFRGDLTADWRAQHPDVEPAHKLLERIRTERRYRWEQSELAKMRAKGKEPQHDQWKAKYRAPAEPIDYLGPLPSGWTAATIEDLAVEGPSNGWSPPSSSDAQGTLTLKLTATTSGRFIANEKTTKRIEKAVAKESKYWLRNGDVLIQRANAIEYVGIAAVYRGRANTYIYPDLMMRIRFGESVSPAFVVSLVNSLPLQKWLKDRATGTAGSMPKVNGATVRKLPIPIAPKEEQVEIAKRVWEALRSVDRLRDLLTASLRLLGTLESSVLTKAFSGDLVRQDCTDAPVSGLLDALKGDRASHRKETRTPKPRSVAPAVGADSEKAQSARQSPRSPTVSAAAYTREQWRSCLLAAVDGNAVDRDEAIRLGAEWARENLGLNFKRLRSDGKIVTGLKSAMNSAIRRGELERIGPNKVRRPK